MNSQGELIGKALAFAFGDMRDWPLECPVCWSKDLIHDPEKDQFMCRDCHHWFSGEIMSDHRMDVARADIAGRSKPRMMV